MSGCDCKDIVISLAQLRVWLSVVRFFCIFIQFMEILLPNLGKNAQQLSNICFAIIVKIKTYLGLYSEDFFANS